MRTNLFSTPGNAAITLIILALILWIVPKAGGWLFWDAVWGKQPAAACDAVVERMSGSLPVTDRALATGIARAYLRGRFERCTMEGVEWIFDVGHNPAAAQGLRASLDRLPRAPRTLIVFAAMRDKDLAGVVAPFVSVADGWHVAQGSADRGATPAELAALLESAGARRVATAPDIASAVQAARGAARRGDRVHPAVVVVGHCDDGCELGEARRG